MLILFSIYLIARFTSILLTEFKLDDKAKDYVSQGKKNYKAFCNSLNISYIEVPNHGRKDCKKFKVSPDSVMQLAFQVREICKFYMTKYSKTLYTRTHFPNECLTTAATVIIQ
jgi:hypothetical protein